MRPLPMVNAAFPDEFSVFPLHDNPVPAVIRLEGVAKNDAHSVEEAEDGIRR